ncbi:MAG: DUF1631 domain-containing protein [Gammaproteobacteria bacterium]|nr:DUF1631 domain-containing protein [Gammaproteobacteria bacterium]
MERSASGTVSRMQPVLQECRDLALGSFTSRLAAMFEKTEQALLDFIDKADTNQGQFQFIDAISVASSNRGVVEQRFREELARGFSEYGKERAISYPQPVLESQFQAETSLQLVDDQELDKRLSLQNMISRAQSDCFQELYALTRRLSMVRGGEILSDQDIPGGPVHAASAFQVAAEEFGFDTNILLIMYALYEKFVMRELLPFYQEFNEKLIEAGVFPNLKFEAPVNPEREPPAVFGDEEEPVSENAAAKRASAGSPTGNRAAGSAAFGSGATQGSDLTESDTALGEEIFDSIRDLMATRRRQDPNYSAHPEFNPNAAPRTMADTPVLVQAINHIQPTPGASLLPEELAKGEKPAKVTLDGQILDQVRERLIEERERLFDEVDRNTIPSADLDTIELVGMLFEHVLNEEELPNIAKALISHLHTPYLKVAILDHRFLIDSRHIARQLLNLMVESGLKWIDESDLRRGIYYPMQDGVNRILAEFKDNVDLFEEISETLTRQVEELSQKAKIVESRAQEAAKGRERLESARLRAQRFVQEMIGERRLHPILEHFLNHAWLDKMILMLLRDPMIETSVEWRQVLTIIDDIIWMYESRENQELKLRQKEKLDGLKQRIESGLNSVGDFHQPDLKALFDYLDSLAGTKDETKESVDEAGKKASAPPKEIKRAPAKPKAMPIVLNREEEALVETLKKVKFGTWFQLEDDKQVSHQLKLSWFSPVTQKYMFVNKSGVQALVTPIEKLAKQMHAGRARILKYPSIPFVDRALDSVLGMLQKTFGR